MGIGHSQFVHLSYGAICLMKSNVLLVLIVLNQSLRHIVLERRSTDSCYYRIADTSCDPKQTFLLFYSRDNGHS